MLVSVLLSLHVGVFVLIAATLLPGEAEVTVAGVKVEVVLFLFAVLYFFLAVASAVPSYHWKFGLALSVIAVPFFVILLAVFLTLASAFPKSGWFIVLSLMDSVGFVLLLLFIRVGAR